METKVFFQYFGYSADRTFKDIDDALEFIKSRGFDAIVYRETYEDRNDILASWSSIGGTKIHTKSVGV